MNGMVQLCGLNVPHSEAFYWFRVVRWPHELVITSLHTSAKLLCVEPN